MPGGVLQSRHLATLRRRRALFELARIGSRARQTNSFIENSIEAGIQPCHLCCPWARSQGGPWRGATLRRGGGGRRRRVRPEGREKEPSRTTGRIGSCRDLLRTGPPTLGVARGARGSGSPRAGGNPPFATAELSSPPRRAAAVATSMTSWFSRQDPSQRAQLNSNCCLTPGARFQRTDPGPPAAHLQRTRPSSPPCPSLVRPLCRTCRCSPAAHADRALLGIRSRS